MNEPSALKGCKIGFIGGGNMAHAIIEPLLKKEIIMPNQVFVSTKTENTRSLWEKLYDAHSCESNLEVIRECNVIFLATKPQCLYAAMNQSDIIQISLTDKIFVSLAAGVTLEKLNTLMSDSGFQHPVKIIRTMPNMPLSVCDGITLYCRNSYVDDKAALPVIELFSHLGIVEEIDESLMNVAGALTGCGPAFAYLMIEALADGAVNNGLPRELATKLAAQVLVGAGKMVTVTDKHPGQLKDAVCSPGGTTIAGIHQLEIGSVRASLMNAIAAATKKSKELNI